METKVETVARKIPEGSDCGDCDLHDGSRCALFDEPYDGHKNVYCFRNKHVDSVHQAWTGEGRR